MSTPPLSVNVKSMISIFENQTYTVNNETSRLVKRAKSFGGVSSTPKLTNKRSSEPVNFHEKEKSFELTHIKQQIEHLWKNLENYKLYSRDTHVYYQNQILFLLTDIVNLPSKNVKLVDKKSELIELIKRLNKTLNSRLPTGYTKELHITTSSIENEALENNHAVESVRKVIQEDSKGAENDDETYVSSTPSVKMLKQLFEKKDSNVPKPTYNLPVSRCQTFNGIGDTKYIPYSEKLKLKDMTLDADLNTNNITTPGQDISQPNLEHSKESRILYDDPDIELENYKATVISSEDESDTSSTIEEEHIYDEVIDEEIEEDP